MEALKACIPVPALVQLVIGYQEPLEWWRYIPDIDERLAVAKLVGITVIRGFDDCDELEKFAGMVLNSRVALFGAFTVEFICGFWTCRASSRRVEWSMRTHGWKSNNGFWAPYRLHREHDQPATIFLPPGTGNVSLEWRMAGVLHREHDRPAMIGEVQAEWYVFDRRHRDGGKPARICLKNNTVEWFNDGKRYSLPAPSPKLKIPTPLELDGLRAWLKEETSLARWAN